MLVAAAQELVYPNTAYTQSPEPDVCSWKPVMESGNHEFSNAREGSQSPLAKRLFAIDGVTSVFLGADFITITKKADASWSVLKPLAFAAIMDHFASGEPLFTDAATLARSDTAIHEDDDEEDGGDITYKSFDPDTGVVTVKMLGACSGRPSSTVTLKSGIENMLMHYIPEVKGVIEAGPDEGEEEGLKELRRLEAALGDTQPA
ncbi:scaffold protein Nfu/NifU N terminal-domain-containing protein [Haematococcus lacustris]